MSLGLYFISLFFVLLSSVHVGLAGSNPHGGAAAGTSSQQSAVHLWTDTVLEVNGVSNVADVFGITAYNNILDFTSKEAVEFLKQHNVDFVGLGKIVGRVLPSSKSALNTTMLRQWFESGEAWNLYQTTEEYKVLQSRGIHTAGAKPFIYLKNPDGSCFPYAEQLNCYSSGTPVALNGSTVEERFLWWSTLFSGYFNCCKRIDPSIDYVHIWNEPNVHFYMDGKDGHYYAQFYTAVAVSLRKQWPDVKIGGPVLWDVPIGPFTTKDNCYDDWYGYVKPLVDEALPKDLIDFVDFHAYDIHASPEVLLNSLQTLESYTWLAYKKHLPVSITETNYCLQSVQNREIRFQNRTFPLLLSTLALMRRPDLVITRQIFDYKANTSSCFYAFVNGDNSLTPDTELYYLMGQLAGGHRLHVNFTDAQISDDSCSCYDTSALGNTKILAEAASVGDNITLALVNTCNCSIDVSLIFEDGSGLEVLSSWAAVSDSTSLREVKAPLWPKDEIALLPLSLLVASYHVKSHQSSKKYSLSSVMPTNVSTVMKEIPVDIPCGYKIDTTFNITQEIVRSPAAVYLNFGILGKPSTLNWSVTFNCKTEQATVLVSSPGTFSEVAVPCTLQTNSEGLTEVLFTTVTCAKVEAKEDFQKLLCGNSSPAYFASATLTFHFT